MDPDPITTGIVFLKTTQIDVLERFYVDEVGCELWMDQHDCRIFRHGTFLFGFCERDEPETQGVLTFVVPGRTAVDEAHRHFAESALGPPSENPRYPIYNFFARDPEGRLIEFQVFTNDPDLEALVPGPANP